MEIFLIVLGLIGLVVILFLTWNFGYDCAVRGHDCKPDPALEAYMKECEARAEIDAIFQDGIKKMNDVSGQSWRNIIES